MENQNFYEGRILVNMAAFVMRQDDLKPLHGNLDWEKLTLDNDTFENTGKSRFFERRTSRVLY